MVEVETSVDQVDGVTVVRATVTNTRSTPQIVRLESQLDGPTWPPRRGAVSAPCWSDGVWERAIRPSRSIGVGFASPAEPVEPPLELVEVQRASEEDFEPADQVLAALDRAIPPRCVFEEQV
jgi:hypothetical protein